MNKKVQERINSCIYKAGTKFTVTGEIKNKNKGSLSPGSCGFVSHVRGGSKKYPYMIALEVVVTRIGKKGKNRIQAFILSVPMFFVKGIKIPVNEMPGCVCITQFPLEHKNLLEINNLDFLAWGLSEVRYLNKLSSRAPSYMWPEEKNMPINVLFEIEGRFNNDPGHTLKALGDKIFREQAILAIREMESSLIKCHAEYNERVSIFEKGGIAFIQALNNEENGKLHDKEIIKNTVLFYQEKAQRMMNLSRKGATEIDSADILSNIFQSS